MSSERQVEFSGKVIVLSEKAAAFANTPAPVETAPVDRKNAGGWWIAITASSLEKRAEVELHAAAVETWLPLRSVPIRNAHIRTLVERGRLAQPYRTFPEYPGYVLIRPWVHTDEFWHAVRDCRHVQGIIINDGRPMRVHDDIVSDLAARMTCQLNVPANQAFALGQSVAFALGDLCSFNGKVSRRIGNDMLRVLVRMLGGERTIDVHADRLVKIA